MALHERLAAEEDLRLLVFPDARPSNAGADEGVVADSRAGAFLNELPEHPVGVQPWRGKRVSNQRAIADYGGVGWRMRLADPASGA